MSGSDPEPVGWRNAKTNDSGCVPVLIVRPRVVGVEATDSERVIQLTALAVALQPFTNDPYRSALRGQRHSSRAVASLCKKLDDSGQRARSIDRALRPAHNLDPVDVVDRNIGEIEKAGQTLVQRHAIQQHLGVLASQSAHEH